MSSKKSRSFKCRDALWQTFEQMAHDLECSVDYLVNDAMKQYARQRGYKPSGNSAGISLSPSGSSAAMSAAPPPPPPPVSLGAAPTAAIPAAPPKRAVPASPFPSPGGTAPAPPITRAARAAPPPPPVPTTRRPPPPAPGVVSRRAAPPPPAMPRSMPPPPPGGMRPPPPIPGAQAGRSGALAIHYQGEVFPISKDRFIIGRGKQSSDLTIKDPNVSRQHAMIEFLNGQYYIVDMGSTNGVEYNGQRVQRRLINEGDIFRVCDHELRFSFV